VGGRTSEALPRWAPPPLLPPPSLADVGQPKATVAAAAIMARVAGVTVTPHHARIEDKDASFYARFHIIVLGLDSLEARRHMNAVVCGMLQYGEDGEVDPSTIKPLVDGGTEGFRGHVRTIVPAVTPCFECTLWMFPPQTTYPLCTLAETPRSAPHCVEYARLVLWPVEREGVEFDADMVRLVGVGRCLEGAGSTWPTPCPCLSSQEEHLAWVHARAAARASAHGIPPFPPTLTAGVVKRIVPAIASTNAVVAAICSLEVLKAATMLAPGLNNYMLYSGGDGVYAAAAAHEREAGCPACSPGVRSTARAADALGAWLDAFACTPEATALAAGGRLAAPSVHAGARPLAAGGAFAADTARNRARPLADLLPGPGPHALVVNDRALPGPLRVRLTIEE